MGRAGARPGYARPVQEPRRDTAHWREIDAPRIPPARSEELNILVRPLVAIAGRVIGGPPPNIISTLARHGRLFVPWLLFASRLMPRGTLPRRDTELVILRVAHNSRCRYEWDHHVRIGSKAGLSAEQIGRVANGPDAGGWSEREAALLTACDELHADRFITDATWSRLSEFLSHTELIELCMLVGHYEMLAGTIASAGIQPEQSPAD
jgi:AhpD family alkylhydroperoxidase